MLEFLRKGAKSWVAKGLILLLIASFAVWGISDVFTTGANSAVAQYGEQVVTVEEYADQLVRARSQLSQQAQRAITFAEFRDIGYDQLVLAQLVRQRVMAAELAEIGISAPDDAVAEAIRAIPGFGGATGFSAARYRSALAQQGYSPAQFEELTRVTLGQSVLFGAAEGTGTAPPGLGPRIAAYQGERRSVIAVLLTPERAPDPGAPDAAALKAQYEATPDAYTAPERRSGLYVHVDFDALVRENAPQETQIEDWYAENADTLGEPAARVIDQLPLPEDAADAHAASVIDGTKSFEDLARELGEDPAGLDIGRVVQGDLPEAVESAVFAAAEPGIVGPLQAPSGAVLVRIREVVEGGTPPLAEVRDLISAQLARDAALDRAPEFANEIDELRAAGKSLEEIAEATGLTLGRFDQIAESGALPGGDVADGVVGTDLFLTEVFAAIDHEERDLVETREGGFFLVLVERIEDSRLQDLDEVREQVASDWAMVQRVGALEEEAKAAVESLAGAPSLADWAEAEGLTTTEHLSFPRDRAPSMLPFALVSDLFDERSGDAAWIALPGAAGVMLAEVTAIEPLAPEQLGRIAERVESTVADQLAQDQTEFFARAIEASLEGGIDPTAVEATFNMLGAAREGY